MLRKLGFYSCLLAGCASPVYPNPLMERVRDVIAACSYGILVQSRVDELAETLQARAPFLNSRVPIVSELPRGIPSELVPAFNRLSRLMGDGPRFAKWLANLELELQAECARMEESDRTITWTPELRLKAIKAVIQRRALAAGWPAKILVLRTVKWRDMLSQESLFIDSSFRDLARKGEGGAHTASAHLLQLLYASEELGNDSGLRRMAVFKDKNPMRVLMRFMGDSYIANGEKFETDTKLRWNGASDPYESKSLWVTFFDAGRNRGTVNSPENFGAIYHDLPILREMEHWSNDAQNFWN